MWQQKCRHVHIRVYSGEIRVLEFRGASVDKKQVKPTKNVPFPVDISNIILDPLQLAVLLSSTIYTS